MKKSILLATFLLLSIVSFGQTNISGGIASNTTWTIENSPYIVTGDIAVFQNYTLTIEPGVIVKFEDNTQLIIRGSIVAIGNNSNNITFTSNNPNPQKGSWNRIELDIYSSFNFDYVTFEYANNCLFYYHPSSGKIKNSTFQNNNNGINRDGYALSTLNIENTKFINNDIGITEYLDEVNLKNCEFKNNRIGANITDSNIDSCLFEGNTDLGLQVWSSILTNSTFINNGVGLEKNFNTSFFPSKMTGNTIKNNKIGIKVGHFSSGVDVSNNTICNNTQYNVLATRSNNADFSNNCWCTEDSSEIEKKIYHGLDDINVGLINFNSPSSYCPDSTIEVSLSLNDFSDIQQFSIYPNPVHDNLNIELNSGINFIKGEIYNMQGQMIMKTNETMFSIERLPSSTYFIKIFTSKGTNTGRFIKK